MSRSVYLPVEVHEDGTFGVEWEGLPWPNDNHNVWDDDGERWESSSIEGPNNEFVSDAEERVARASRLLEAWLKIEDRVVAFVERAGEWEKQRQAIFDVEGETGYLDHDAIHANEDDAVALVEEAAALMEEIR